MIAFNRKEKESGYLKLFFFAMMCLFLLLFLLSITAFTGSAQEEIKKSIQIINPRPDFALSLRLDKGAGATYAPGERIRITFRSSRSAYVTIFGYDSRGNIRLLFPNQFQRNSLIEANKEYHIDGVIEPGTPTGIEYIQGFATRENIIVSREMERALSERNYPIIGEGIDLFTRRIRGILTNASPQTWVTSETLHYQVIDRSAQTGQLRVSSVPSGSDVYLGERYAGKTPLSMDQVRVGDYEMRVESPGYLVWARRITINPNRATTIHADLDRMQQYGSISVRADQDNARIYLDGQYKGISERNRNVILEQVTEGSHDIRVTLGGYQDWTQRVQVRPNQRVQVNVNLERIIQTGSLEIDSNVDNAMIYLNGEYQRRTSINRTVRIDNIREGSHELLITKEGYLDYITNIRITPGQINYINIRMEPEQKNGSIAINCNESNARIFVNGVYMATTSANQARIIDELEEGIYEIAVIKDGFRTWLDEIRVYAGETTSVFCNLIRAGN
ncbi:MAG: PEGA domain-containing protein [Candidatus Caldatribacteriota bacterium]